MAPVIQWNVSGKEMKWSQWSNEMVPIIEWNALSNLMKCHSNPMKCFQLRNEMAPAI